MELTSVVTPFPGRETDGGVVVFMDDRYDKQVIAKHELLVAMVESLVRKDILHLADDWFAGFSSMARKFKNFRREFNVQFGRLSTGCVLFPSKKAPWRRGELHHGHASLNLA